jgi:hypothetical protein
MGGKPHPFPGDSEFLNNPMGAPSFAFFLAKGGKPKPFPGHSEFLNNPMGAPSFAFFLAKGWETTTLSKPSQPRNKHEGAPSIAQFAMGGKPKPYPSHSQLRNKIESGNQNPFRALQFSPVPAKLP